MGDLEKITGEKKEVLPNVEEFRLASGKKIILLAQGRLVNLAAGAGHPSEVMDMSFADQALVLEYLAKNARGLKAGVHEVPLKIDLEVAKLKAESMGVGIEQMTAEQEDYLSGYAEGT